MKTSDPPCDLCGQPFSAPYRELHANDDMAAVEFFGHPLVAHVACMRIAHKTMSLVIGAQLEHLQNNVVKSEVYP